MKQDVSPVSRPLDAAAAALAVVLCLSWGFNQVADQARAARHSAADPGRVPLDLRRRSWSSAWSRGRGVPLMRRDGTLVPGLVAGAAVRARVPADLSRPGLDHARAAPRCSSTSRRSSSCIGARWFLPGDRFHLSQWLGLVLSFAGMVVAFGVPAPAPRSAPADRRRHAGARRRRLGRHHAGHQGERARRMRRPKRRCSISWSFRAPMLALGAYAVRRADERARRRRWRSARSPIRPSGS